MKKSMIRLLSLMLCLITLLSLLPMTALAATTLGAPKNLTWNKAYDDQTPTLKTKYGSVCWQPTEPIEDNGVINYEICLYKDDELVHGQWMERRPGFVDENTYITFDLSPFIEGASGTYYFTLTAVSRNSSYKASKTVKSGTWKYTQPDDKMTKPKNPEWDWPEMTWDKISNSSARYEVLMFYSPTKPDSIDEMGWIHREWNINGDSNIPPYGDNGPGYYAFKVRTMSSDIRKNRHSSWVTSEIYHYKMDTPKAKHSAVESSGKPKISWNAVEFAEKYEVYRATSKDGKFEKVKTTTSKSYTDKEAKAGKIYYYKVRAVTELGAKSSYSNVVNRYCDLPQPEVKAETVSSSGKIKVSWEKISGAEKYVVYRSDAKDGKYTEVKTTTSTSFTDSKRYPADQYWYKVKALHAKESANSAQSDAVCGTVKLARPDVTIKNSSGTGKPKLSWDAIKYAVGYKVYRASSSGGTYKLLAEISDLSYTDTTATAGKKYYYRVMAFYDESAGNSAKSSAEARTCDLARPDVSIKLNSSGDPKLSWGEISGAEKYYVYRATSKSGDYKKIKTTTSTSFTDKDVKAGKTYYYKVKAIHSNTSANSAYSSVDYIKAK